MAEEKTRPNQRDKHISFNIGRRSFAAFVAIRFYCLSVADCVCVSAPDCVCGCARTRLVPTAAIDVACFHRLITVAVGNRAKLSEIHLFTEFSHFAFYRSPLPFRRPAKPSGSSCTCSHYDALTLMTFEADEIEKWADRDEEKTT